MENSVTYNVKDRVEDFLLDFSHGEQSNEFFYTQEILEWLKNMTERVNSRVAIFSFPIDFPFPVRLIFALLDEPSAVENTMLSDSF